MRILSFLFLMLIAGVTFAEVNHKAIDYQDEETQLQGHLYWDGDLKHKRPGILLIHEWWGLNDYAQKRAKMLAELGYVVFAADMYGPGKVTKDPKQAKEWMQEVTVDPELWRLRAEAALRQLQNAPLVDKDKIAALGYCFGGGTILQMAYGGSDISAIVSFHGSLPAVPDEAKGKITADILLFHGHADSFVAPEVVQNFQDKLDASGANWEMVVYGNAKHGFTNPDAKDYGIENLKYNPVADQRSWTRAQEFLKRVFEGQAAQK